MTTIQNWKNHVEKLHTNIVREKHEDHNKTIEVSVFCFDLIIKLIIYHDTLTGIGKD